MRRELGKSAIVATLNAGVGNKTICLRADMDALPVEEQSGLMFNLGVKEYDGTFGALHNGKMTVNEDVLDTPAKIFVEFVLDQMEG